MPLIVITGFPASGKTHRTNELKEYFESRGKNVKVVSENVAVPMSGFGKNECFGDSQKEKIIRAHVKSEVVRLLNKDDVIILDASNYIKGYRYELYCVSKAARTTQCTVYCALSKDQAWKFNEQRNQSDEPNLNGENTSDNSSIPYTREVFDALLLRYEEPIANNRWDSPLFTILSDRKFEFEEVYAALFVKKPPPPHLATQNVRSTLFVYEDIR